MVDAVPTADEKPGKLHHQPEVCRKFAVNDLLGPKSTDMLDVWKV